MHPASESPEIRFTRLDPDLDPPSRAHPGDGAVDLRAAVPVRLAPGERMLVPTGVAVAVPVGYAGWVVPRSGLAARLGLSVVNAPGLVDAGYRGEVKVVLVNLGSEAVELERGERIAQLAVAPVSLAPWVEVPSLDSTSRGEGGFGSSGRI